MLPFKTVEADLATQSIIECTAQTWKPTTHYAKISPGCENRDAEVIAHRLHAMGTPGDENRFKLLLREHRLIKPLLRNKPTRSFPHSMRDLFHEAVADTCPERVFSIIERTPHHMHQILPKRVERRPAYFAHHTCPRNPWLGVVGRRQDVRHSARCTSTQSGCTYPPPVRRTAAGRPWTIDLRDIDRIIFRSKSDPRPGQCQKIGGTRAGSARSCWCGLLFQALGCLGC